MDINENNASTSSLPMLNISAGKACVFMLCVFIICYILTALLLYFLNRISDNQTAMLRIGTVAQDVILFIIPALATAMIASRRPAMLLGLLSKPGITAVLLVGVVMIVSIPAQEAVIYWNANADLSFFGTEIEQLAKRLEEASAGTINELMGDTSVLALIVNILVIGIAAGFAEELLFRGCLLRIMLAGRLNRHIAVWLVAFIFSAMHFQFYGFIPRMLLGAYFGYLMVWSRSLWLPVLAHVLNNSVYALTAWFQVRKEGITALDAEPELWSAPATIGSIVLTAFAFYLLWHACRAKILQTSKD